MTKRAASKPRGVLYYLGIGLSAGLFAFVLLVGVLAVILPAATGSTPMTVLTGSMTPAYPPGTLIIVKPIEAAEIRIGDPISFQLESGKPAVVTHRVVSVTTTSSGEHAFQTKGDANNAIDEKTVIPEQIRGKVWYAIPYLGYVNSALNGEARPWLIPLIAIGLFAYAGYLVASTVVAKFRTSRKSGNGVADWQADGEPVEATISAQPEHGRRSAGRQ